MDETLTAKYDTYWLSHDLHPLLIQENYINNTLKSSNEVKILENIAYSAESLSDSDLFEAYVNMTNWEFQPCVALNVIKSTIKCNKKCMIKFPQFLGRTSAMNKNKRDKINYENIELFNKPKVKELKIKEQKGKEPKVKETKVKEPKVKEPKVKEPKVKKEKVIKEKVIKEKVIKDKVIKEKVIKEPKTTVEKACLIIEDD